MLDMFTPHAFLNLLCEQAELLERLIDSGQQQQQTIEAGRMSELVAILGQKQPRLERLGAIGQQIQERRREVEQSGFWPDESVRRQCQTMRDRAAESFEHLIQLEQRCEQALNTSREQIQQRLQTIESSRHAASAYQSHAQLPAPPRGDFSSVG